ncbi:MAG: hypothetical protein NC830_02785 [Candidatus Omnitrophica bacterium]|nr:hypothetical protein [Candidatus Omnitrophota bacterium]
MTKILPIVAIRFIFGGGVSKKNLLFLYNCILSIMKKEFFSTDFSSEYPAILHINIDRRGMQA